MFHRALLLLLLVSLPLHARDWYVANDGDNVSGDGTREKPYRTVSRVLDTSLGETRDGDTILLRAGTYHECDVRLRKRLTLRSMPGESAHIHCDLKVKDSVVIQIDPEASGSRLSDLEISGGMYYGVQLQTAWYRGDGQQGRGASNVLLENLRIHDTGRDGIKITPKCDHVTIRGSEIWNTGAADAPGTPLEQRNAEGIDNVGGSFMLVEDSHVHDTATTGIYFKGGASDVIVQRNRIENAGMSGILVGFDTSEEFFDLEANPEYYEALRGVVRNNLIRNTGYAGIGLYAARDAVVVNNTIIDAARLGHAALYFGIPFQDWDPKAGRPASVNPLIRNNLLIQHGRTCVEIRWSRELGGLSALAGSPGTDFNAYGNHGGDCRFVDMRTSGPLFGGLDLDGWRQREGSDAHSLEADIEVEADGALPAGSAAIDRGATIEQVSDDLDGRKRSPPFDIGALESAPRSP